MENQIAKMINGMQHVVIPVSNISLSEAVYSRLGFENVMQSTFMIDGEPDTFIIMKNKEVIIELYQIPSIFLEGWL